MIYLQAKQRMGTLPVILIPSSQLVKLNDHLSILTVSFIHVCFSLCSAISFFVTSCLTRKMFDMPPYLLKILSYSALCFEIH